MSIGERIKARRIELDMTQEELARKMGYSSRSTINKIELGLNDVRQSNVPKFAKALDTTIGYLMGQVGAAPTPVLTEAARRVAQKYAALDDHGRAAVDAILAVEQARGEVRPVPVEQHHARVIPLLGQRFAAGTGEPEGDMFIEDYKTDNPRAEFAIHVNGDSMEPYLPDGSIALGVKRTPQDGETGAFFLDGEFLVKQVCADSEGNVYLFSLNRDRADADVTIWADADRRFQLVGTILLDKLPLPE